MKKAIRLYVLVTQFIFTMVLGGILGAVFGEKANPDGGDSIGSGIGLIISFFISILMIWQFIRNERLTSKDD